MPGGDGTGPAGLGPMTGRAAGLCAGYPTPGYMSPGPGWGFGRGGGWGRRNRFYATGLTGWQRAAYVYPSYAGTVPYNMPYSAPYGQTVTKQQELDALKGEAEYLEDAMDGINKRIAELEAEIKKG
jgi:hypothetical protein